MPYSLLTVGPLAAALAAGMYFAPHKLRLMQQRALARFCKRTRSLVLSYDDGPSAVLTPRLLDLLRDSNIKATFFLLGRNVAGHESIVDRAQHEGHGIECHGHDHTDAWKTAPWRPLRDIRKGYAALEKWVPPHGLFRPPRGKLTLCTWLALRSRRARIGWWTIDSGDTHATLPTPESVVARVLESGGGVVLLHDHHRTEPRMRFVLETTRLLVELAQRNGLATRRLGDVLDELGADHASAVLQRSACISVNERRR
ncbi:MAG: polysaccharide deacetylase family protein [Planctomycetota bacterium]|nr:polysaccharide deacetylase family protein [Planctomycetota bacterium]